MLLFKKKIAIEKVVFIPDFAYSLIMVFLFRHCKSVVFIKLIPLCTVLLFQLPQSDSFIKCAGFILIEICNFSGNNY